MDHDAAKAEADAAHYAVGYNKGATDMMASRSVERAAGFLLPYLRPGMRVLDCGCGPGSISTGLAACVAPGNLVGIDIEQSQVEAATERARALGLSNARFERANLLELPFADGSFDAAFVNTVLCHVTEPLAAMREIHRVLAPGGVLGARDTDYRAGLVAPEEPLLLRYRQLLEEMVRRNGDPYIGVRLPALARLSGFTSVAISAVYECSSGEEELRVRAERVAHMFGGSFGKEVVALGLSTEAELEAVVAAYRQYASHPDRFSAVAFVQVVARKS